MAKPFNQDLRNKILAFIKKEWLMNGQKQFSCSLSKIAEAVGGQRGEKVWYYITALNNSNRIKVEWGKGSVANKYTFVSDEPVGEIYDRKEENTKIIGDYFKSLNENICQITNYMNSNTEEAIRLLGELTYLKDNLIKVKSIGSSTEGSIIFEGPPEMAIIINELKSSSQNNQSNLQPN